jgi:hypothetical protein
LALIKDTLILENIQWGVTYKSQNNNGLGDAGTLSGNGLYLSIKIHFQGQSCCIKNSAAIVAIAQVSLDFTSHFGSQPAFQIFTD